MGAEPPGRNTGGPAPDCGKVGGCCFVVDDDGHTLPPGVEAGRDPARGMKDDMPENEITLLTEEIYDELMRDTPAEPDEKLRAAARRARKIIDRR